MSVDKKTADDFLMPTEGYVEIRNAAIAFAKMHVSEALKQASEKAEIVDQEYNDCYIDNDSIINAYPLENIK